MGVGVRIVSENLNPRPGIAGEGKPQWRQKTLTESAGVGKLSHDSGTLKVSSKRRSAARRRRKRSAGAPGGGSLDG